MWLDVDRFDWTRHTTKIVLVFFLYCFSIKVGYYGLFGKPILVIRDMEIVKKVMIKDFDHFKNRGFGVFLS